MIHDQGQEKDTGMSSHQSNLRLRCVSPLQFTLVTPKEEVYEAILKLRKKAQSLFPKVSKVFRLFDEACLPSESHDPLLDVKLLGQGLIINDNKIQTVNPESIVGFGILLPTNRVSYIALASYPVAVKRAGKTIQVPFNGNAVWSGIFDTFMAKCNNCRLACEKCISSHELACSLLQEADKIGILKEVKDPTDFWTTRSSDSLVEMSNRLRCGCLSETA